MSKAESRDRLIEIADARLTKFVRLQEEYSAVKAQMQAEIDDLKDQLAVAVDKARESQADNDHLRNTLIHNDQANERVILHLISIVQPLRDLNITELSPLDALTALFELQRKAKGE